MQIRTHMAAAIGLVLLPGLGAAQQPSKAQANAIRQLCRSDFQAHCSGVAPGGSAALGCLRQNIASLSEPCQQALQAATAQAPAPMPAQPAPAPPSAAAQAPAPRREEVAALRRSCRADYRMFCSDIEPGGGRALACLHAHGPQLSSPCRSALASVRSSR